MTAGDASPLVGIDWDAITLRPPFAVDEAAVRDCVGGRRVLVTGAAGSLGAPLAASLALANPARLVVYDHHESSLFHLREALGAAHPSLGLRPVLGDVRDRRRLHGVLAEERPHLVFHLAAYKHVPWGEEDPEAFAAANILGARHVIDGARDSGVERIVYPSTDKAIDPPSLYGATKRLAEAMLRTAAAEGEPGCSIVRFVNVLGSQGSAPEKFARQLRTGRPLTITDPEMRRYWITPQHANLLLLHAACLALPAERAITVAPDAGDEISILDIARRVARAIVPQGPEPAIAVTGRRPGERLAEPLTAAHEWLEPLPLPGLLAVRGICPPPPGATEAAVAAVSQLLDRGASAAELRTALFGAP
ncbi:MAG TPA: polysaccharide biosynthesis protein [Chloroflexota bacterium]|nr:polysaccharide biosynthesis protein [Chloroflexota bacterium]